MVADIVCGLAQAATAALIVLGVADLWNLAALRFVGGAAGAFLMPAIKGLVPQIVVGPQRKEANALLSLSRNGARIGGAAIGCALVAGFGAGPAIAIDAATFFVSALLLAWVTVDGPVRLSRAAPAPRRARDREDPRLVVLPTDVVNAADRWPVSERAMRPSPVVVVEPVWQRLVALSM